MNIFRYRALTNCCCGTKIHREFSNLEKNDIWMSSPIDFNDPFDCAYRESYLDMLECMNLSLQKRLFSSADDLRNLGISNVDLDRIVNSIDVYKEWCNTVIKLQPSLQKGIEAIFGFLYKDHLKRLNALKNAPRATLRVACFTSQCDNPLMWAHYASMHTGFCVEYSIRKHVKILPVEYVYEPYRLIDALRAIEHGDYNHVVLRKSIHWNYEHELRLIEQEPNCGSVLLDGNDHVSGKLVSMQDKLDIISIYMGARISHDHEKKLRDIALQKECTLYKMKPVNFKIVPEYA